MEFYPFQPGLVGGHCIGVDPYYLAFKAKSVGHIADVIMAGRHVNDYMPKYVAEQLMNHLSKLNINSKNANILLLGFAFKENCPDIRNSKVF